jgi:hypothetical protein
MKIPFLRKETANSLIPLRPSSQTYFMKPITREQRRRNAHENSEVVKQSNPNNRNKNDRKTQGFQVLRNMFRIFRQASIAHQKNHG